MIEIKLTDNDALKVDHWCASPTVYFDHWAWRNLSESEALAARLASALKLRGGTLAISWLNLVEFGRMTDTGQARKADELLDAILPNIFFMQPDFFKVIAEEDKLVAGGVPVAPHADLGLLDGWAKLSLRSQAPLKLVTAQNLHRLAQASGIAAKYDSFADKAIKTIERFRKEFEADPEFRSRVARLPSGPSIQRGTRFLRNELLRSFLVNKTVKVTRNHVVDLSHAVVAAAYCDYLLLDTHWSVQLENARKRIQSVGFSFPIAKVFSANGIDRFLQDLER